MRRPVISTLVVLVVVAACQGEVGLPGLTPLPSPQHALDRALLHLRDVEAVERPYVDAGFIYYTRHDEMGRRVYARRSVEPGADEQILLKGDEVADRTVASLGAFDVSPDERWLAFSTRMAGDRYALRLKDLRSGAITPPIEGTDFTVAWDAAGILYYAALDEQDRPRRVYAVAPDQLARTEPVAVARVPRLVHDEKDPAKEVLVAPVDKDAALFVRKPGPALGRHAARSGLLGYRLGGTRALEGLPPASQPTPTDPAVGGSDLVPPRPEEPAAL